ncbi:hypothetical protein HU200_049062 [Digitaria exilis]|uniref:DUF4220 domain-containing protein n=1 Tax=Digitaria exilis TaxID=1010633 RepID=A0A835ATW1_9POAL|nr:hypothetical protein HU200_049062 [Digitaria exilis]
MWTIKRMGAHLCDGYRKTVIFESLQRPFDESVVLWHLATDLCFYESNDEYDIRDVIRRRCRKLSNYMAYLLFAKPEMLMPGARRSLLKHAREKFSPLLNKIQEDDSDNLELNGGKARATLPVEEVASKIVAQATVEVSNLTFISDVWYLYQDLVRFCKSNGKLEMWRLIEGVWVEKICFAAGRCRGYLHAKSLGEGGEYLSYIWLLLLYMGMETVEQKLRRTDNEGEGMISPLFYVPPAPPFEP